MLGRSGESLRLPQDAEVASALGVPDFGLLQESVSSYAMRHAIALETDSFEQRVEACWGLVARGVEAVQWCVVGLESGETDWADDAAGVLRWVGVPEMIRPDLRRLLERLPEGEAADFLIELFPEVETLAVEDPAASLLEPLQLFEGRMLPFTEPIWFVELPLQQVVGEYQAWMRGLGRGRSYSDLREPLPVMLQRLEPFSMPSWRFLLVSTTSQWTAVFSQGADITSTPMMVSQPSQARNLMTHYSRHVVRDKRVAQYGNRSFELSRGTKGLRTVQASQQGRWEWHASGSLLPFETADRYNAKRIPDRFTLEDLNHYCAALGIRRNEPDFYLPHGCLVSNDDYDFTKGRRMSSQEWRDDHLRN